MREWVTATLKLVYTSSHKIMLVLKLIKKNIYDFSLKDARGISQKMVEPKFATW